MNAADAWPPHPYETRTRKEVPVIILIDTDVLIDVAPDRRPMRIDAYCCQLPPAGCFVITR